MQEFLLDQTSETDNGSTADSVLLIILVNGVCNQDGMLKFHGSKKPWTVVVYVYEQFQID